MKPSYTKKNLIAIDQLINTVLGGYPDETISARCWRSYADGGQRKWSGIAVNVIDTLFWLMRQGKDHCKESYQHELKRLDLPEVYRIEKKGDE